MIVLCLVLANKANSGTIHVTRGTEPPVGLENTVLGLASQMWSDVL